HRCIQFFHVVSPPRSPCLRLPTFASFIIGSRPRPHHEANHSGPLFRPGPIMGPMPETLLIIEDDPANARMVKALFKPEVWRLLEAGTGKAGLDLASQEAPVPASS